MGRWQFPHCILEFLGVCVRFRGRGPTSDGLGPDSLSQFSTRAGSRMQRGHEHPPSRLSRLASYIVSTVVAS